MTKYNKLKDLYVMDFFKANKNIINKVLTWQHEKFGYVDVAYKCISGNSSYFATTEISFLEFVSNDKSLEEWLIKEEYISFKEKEKEIEVIMTVTESELLTLLHLTNEGEEFEKKAKKTSYPIPQTWTTKNTWNHFHVVATENHLI